MAKPTVEVSNPDGVKRVIANTPESRARYEAAGFTVSKTKDTSKSDNKSSKSDKTEEKK